MKSLGKETDGAATVTIMQNMAPIVSTSTQYTTTKCSKQSRLVLRTTTRVIPVRTAAQMILWKSTDLITTEVGPSRSIIASVAIDGLEIGEGLKK